MSLIACSTSVEATTESLTKNVEALATRRIEDLESFGSFFCRFLYSAIAYCSLASVLACSESLARDMMVAVENDFNLVAH